MRTGTRCTTLTKLPEALLWDLRCRPAQHTGQRGGVGLVARVDADVAGEHPPPPRPPPRAAPPPGGAPGLSPAETPPPPAGERQPTAPAPSEQGGAPWARGPGT